MKIRALAAATALCCGATLPLAHATNGYMPHAFSPTAKGMAGAGEAALPQDALSIVGNPAGLTRLGKRLDASVSWFSPLRSYNGAGPGGAPNGAGDGSGKVESDKNNFFIPSIGYSQPLGERGAVGIALFANGGMNTSYSANDTAGGFGVFPGRDSFGNTVATGDAGINLEQMGLSIGYAHDVSEQLSLGASFLSGYQRFKAEGLSGFAGYTETFGRTGDINTVTGLSNNGNDSAFGYGFQVGALWNVNPMLTLGASYRTKTYMQKFDKYSDLFANGGEFDVPALGSIGAAIRPNDRLTIAMDVQQIWYSDIASVGNDNRLFQDCGGQFGAMLATNLSSCLGGSNGAGFGWKDMTVFKIGVQYEVDERLTLRAGYSNGDQPIKESQVAFNVLAPAVIEEHWTIGGTYALKKDLDLGFWGMYAPENSITGSSPSLNDASAFWFNGRNNPTIRMKQYEVGVHLAWQFD